MDTQTAVTMASAATRAASRSQGRRLTGAHASGSGDGDGDGPTDAVSPRAGRSCRGGSPLAETGEGSIDPLGESTLAALEQRRPSPARNGRLRQRPDGFADQFGLAAAAGCRDPLQFALEIIRKVHRRLAHPIHCTIMDTRAAPGGALAASRACTR